MKNRKSSTAKITGKPWHEFEKMVAGLESFLSPQGALVKINDKIRDVQTGRLREVDCSIRYKVGSSLILVVIECRDRSGKQDVTWIEQLSTKKRRIGADVMIGVSASAFSVEARDVARTEGIRLRKIDKIKPDSLIAGLSWTFQYDFYQVVDKKVIFDGNVSEHARAYLDYLFNEQSEHVKADLKIFHNVQVIGPVSSREIFEFFLREYNESNQSTGLKLMADSGKVYRFKKRFEKEWYVMVESEKIELEVMDVSFTLHTTNSILVPDKQPISYQDEQSHDLAEIHNFKSATKNTLFTDFTFHAEPGLANFEISATRYDGCQVQFGVK
jgi:hypothetical protein